MASNLQKKPLLDYQAQIKNLKQKQLAINDEDSTIATLEKVSYYGLINGYKESIPTITFFMCLLLFISQDACISMPRIGLKNILNNIH